MKLTITPQIPPMRTCDEALSLTQRHDDRFYLAAFHLHSWLTGMVRKAIAEYAEKKHAEDRLLQNGRVWSEFQLSFGHISDRAFPLFIDYIGRFLAHDEPVIDLAYNALAAMTIEERANEYWVPDPELPGALTLTRPALIRWCAWFEALLHLQVHQLSHTTPVAFDPDQDKRDLAAIGTNQRHYAHLGDSEQACWLWHFSHAADRFSLSPKWATVGLAMAATQSLPCSYPQVDAAAIILWPIVIRHNWTFRDLLNTIRPTLARPNSYPCDTDQDFATYCLKILGLRKTRRGVTNPHGKPPGHDIAIQILSQIASFRP